MGTGRHHIPHFNFNTTNSANAYFSIHKHFIMHWRKRIDVVEVLRLSFGRPGPSLGVALDRLDSVLAGLPVRQYPAVFDAPQARAYGCDALQGDRNHGTGRAGFGER